ncbi:MAG: hypothetical protein ACT4PT_11655 [Methanobacteriota archaeon]
MSAPAGGTQVGQKVKYFGRILPPKCELRGCFLTDDGKHFYCTDFSCNRHLYRRSKHTRYSRHEHLDPERAQKQADEREVFDEPGSWPLVYFHCPACSSKDIQMRFLANKYECLSCTYQWR